MRIAKSQVFSTGLGRVTVKRQADSIWYSPIFGKEVYGGNGERFYFEKGGITSFDISQDHVVACTKLGEIVIWNRGELNPLIVFSPKDNYWFDAIAFLEADIVALSAAPEHRVLIYSIGQNAIVDVIDNQHSSLQNTIHEDLLLFSVRDGILFYNWRTRNSHFVAISEDIVLPIFSPDGSYFAGFVDNDILIFRKDSYTLKTRLSMSLFEPQYALFLSNKYILASSPLRRMICVWNIDTHEKIIETTKLTTKAGNICFDAKTNEIFVNLYDEVSLQSLIEVWKLVID
jgi:WD40 repeat protein